MIVADTNLIGYLYLESNCSALAEQAWRKDPDWAAPPLGVRQKPGVARLRTSSSGTEPGLNWRLFYSKSSPLDSRSSARPRG